MSDPRHDFRRGEGFSAALHAAVSEHGPEDLTPRERAALAHELVTAAVAWVRRRNRLARAGR